ncbi:para-nitrobenzyl esterase [Bacillus pumilus]|uniref:alpha/beta hydrolase n=1 Tax=Bacillus altitudinis TaxID=293387 RepID=UPI00077692D2|nr:alpha/beta hydrolase [Bacillus altitudinis]AMM89761.1 para-nitrobenzyl esterase [Bacillus pumilus]WRO24775.1 alpha/beta hydrolase [Bacillus altitudinis]
MTLNRIMKWLLFAAVIAGLLVCAFFVFRFNQPKPTTNIHYADTQNKQQTLDIYMPKGKDEDKKKKHPVMIYLHGGGWTGGDKNRVASKADYFTGQGYVFVSMNYRLHPDANFEQMADDTASAIKWVKDHADEYQIDSSKINVMGHSAGGHLTALVATDSTYLKRVGLSPKTINSIVILDGPLNINQFIQAIPSYKKVFGKQEENWTKASPVTYMNQTNVPPVYLVTGWENPEVYRFAEKLNHDQGSRFVFRVHSLSHSDLNKWFGSDRAPKEAQEMTKAVMAFVKKQNQ